MTNLIENNAFRILGLDTSANQKEIMKRYKEIINRLKIDDYPEYDFDINLPKKMRNESSVSDALKKLQSQKARVIEFFFWFNIKDSIDKKALLFMKDGEFTKAIQTWKSVSTSDNPNSYLYKKNLAILYCLLLSKEKNSSYLQDSLIEWHSLSNSEKFWNGFLRLYNSNSEQEISSSALAELKNNITKKISDIYTDLDNSYVKSFQKVFSVVGEKTEKGVLQPIYESIYESIEKLNKIEITEDYEAKKRSESRWKCSKCDKLYDTKDEAEEHESSCKGKEKWYKRMWKVDSEEPKEVREKNRCIKPIQKEIDVIELHLDKLDKMGLYENAQSKVVRDRVAEAIRNVSVSLHNHTTFLDESARLLKIAIKICGTESLKNKLEEEAKQVKKNEKGFLKLDISGTFSGGDLTFYNTFLNYNGTKIFYRDIDWVSYIATSHSINGIPTGTTYKFELTSKDDSISLSPGEEEWNQLIGISKQIIEPILIQKIVRKIFEENVTYNIGGIMINKKGYTRDKFWGGTDEVK